MSFSVVGMSLEPYTLQIGTRIISKVSYLLTNKIIWYVARSRRGIFPSHFFTMDYSGIRLLFQKARFYCLARTKRNESWTPFLAT